MELTEWEKSRVCEIIQKHGCTDYDGFLKGMYQELDEIGAFVAKFSDKRMMEAAFAAFMENVKNK